MYHLNVGGDHSKTRSHDLNQGRSSAAFAQNASGFSVASRFAALTIGLTSSTAGRPALFSALSRETSCTTHQPYPLAAASQCQSSPGSADILSASMTSDLRTGCP